MSLGTEDQTFLDKRTAIVGESGGERSRRNFKGARDVALLHFLFWSELSFLSPGNLPNLGIKPRSTILQAGALPSEPPGKD